MLVPFLEARIEHKWTNGRSSDLSLLYEQTFPNLSGEPFSRATIQWLL